MRLPHLLLESPFFLFTSQIELARALGSDARPEELKSIQNLVQLGLPPVTSRHVLATMFGVNPGLIWSMENRTHRYYRSFSIPKGNKTRHIDAPKVALKIIQKWLSTQLDQAFSAPQHVYGFIKGRSHVQAAAVHAGARWVFSVDIKDFFRTTPMPMVEHNLRSIGFEQEGAKLLACLTCLRGALAQGAPSSPVLSNICFKHVDDRLAEIAQRLGIRLTRYADDIVFSGSDDYPTGLREEVIEFFETTPWTLADKKISLSCLPQRLKVHGLLVHGNHIRLTKGYRHRLRAYKHLAAKDAIKETDISLIKGHLAYGAYVERVAEA